MTDQIAFPPLHDLPPPELEARKQHLLKEIARQPERPRLTERLRLRPPLHRRRWRVAAIAVTAAAAVAITLAVLLPAGNSGGLSSAGRYIHSLPRISGSGHGGRQLVSVVLLRAARTAANPPTTTPGPGQFTYTKSEAVWEVVIGGRAGPAAIAFQPVTREIWIGPDGSGRIREAAGHLLFASHADAAYFYRAYRNQTNLLNAHTSDDHEGPGGLGYTDLSNVPTDPAKLKQLIVSRKLEGGPPGEAETFTIIGDLLRETDAPPAVRSALYTIVSQLPGVQLISSTHDRLGRPGTGVAYVSRGLRNELIFDPQTSALLGEQQSVVQRSKWNPFPPGSVIGSAAYLASGIVNSDSATTSAMP
jgi:hypothetical protein